MSLCRKCEPGLSTRKTNMFVFHALMLMLMCLCLCASENSIRQISGFVLLMFLLVLTLMSRVFSLFMLMLCLCARENQPSKGSCSSPEQDQMERESSSTGYHRQLRNHRRHHCHPHRKRWHGSGIGEATNQISLFRMS